MSKHKHLLIALLFIAVAVSSSTLTVFVYSMLTPSPSKRHPVSTPETLRYDIGEANELCLIRSKDDSKHPMTLYVDDHSATVDSYRGLLTIFVKSEPSNTGSEQEVYVCKFKLKTKRLKIYSFIPHSNEEKSPAFGGFSDL